jgi:hypothetical protein
MKYVYGMQHRCPAIDGGKTDLRIHGLAKGSWLMNEGYDHESGWYIAYCPFCGEKLPEITV